MHNVLASEFIIIYLTNLCTFKLCPVFYHCKLCFVEHLQYEFFPYQDYFLRIHIGVELLHLRTWTPLKVLYSPEGLANSPFCENYGHTSHFTNIFKSFPNLIGIKWYFFIVLRPLDYCWNFALSYYKFLGRKKSLQALVLFYGYNLLQSLAIQNFPFMKMRNLFSNYCLWSLKCGGFLEAANYCRYTY